VGEFILKVAASIMCANQLDLYNGLRELESAGFIGYRYDSF